MRSMKESDDMQQKTPCQEMNMSQKTGTISSLSSLKNSESQSDVTKPAF